MIKYLTCLPNFENNTHADIHANKAINKFRKQTTDVMTTGNKPKPDRSLPLYHSIHMYVCIRLSYALAANNIECWCRNCHERDGLDKHLCCYKSSHLPSGCVCIMQSVYISIHPCVCMCVCLFLSVCVLCYGKI